MTPIYFFGVWSTDSKRPTSVGHYLYSPSGNVYADERKQLPEWLWDGTLDGGFQVNAEERYRRAEPERTPRLTVKDGWTILAYWDRSGDSRGASNASFIAQGTHTEGEMLGLARLHFPHLVKRMGLESGGAGA